MLEATQEASPTLSATIFIPARYQSSRFPGKPLQMLRGAGGEARSLIRRSWDAATAVAGTDSVFVLTDDTRIADAVTAFGGNVLMTTSTPRNGTERCAEALAQLPASTDVIVNLQGDAPLTPPHYIEALLEAMEDRSVEMATPVLKTAAEHLKALQKDRAEGRVGATTAVFARNGNALYFSKEIIPFYDNAPDDAVPVYHHVGAYAYRPDALRRYAELPEGALEKREGLEQLRFLENAIPVRCVEVDARGRAFWELNNPSDVPLIEAIMAKEGIA